MANNPFFSDATTGGAVNSMAANANGGYLVIYSGPQPGDANQTATGTLLAKLPLSATAFALAAASGTDGLNVPAAPVPTTLGSGGTILAGVYTVETSYVNPSGETTGSASGAVTTTGSVSTITIPSPAASSNATAWYAYVSQAGGTTLTRQQTAGSPTALGTNLTLTAPPTSSGFNPQGVNTTSSRIVTATANAITSAAALATGTAGYFAIIQSDGLTVVLMGSLGTTGCDLNLNSTALVSGTTVSCASFTITQSE